jgi:hypothetical protein
MGIATSKFQLPPRSGTHAFATAKGVVNPVRITPHEDLIAYLRRIRKCLTTRELSTLLKKHPESVYRMIALGFPAIRDGARWKFDPSKVADWLEQRTTLSSARAAPENNRPTQ